MCAGGRKNATRNVATDFLDGIGDMVVNAIDSHAPEPGLVSA
jgi:hypothetical protein